MESSEGGEAMASIAEVGLKAGNFATEESSEENIEKFDLAIKENTKGINEKIEAIEAIYLTSVGKILKENKETLGKAHDRYLFSCNKCVKSHLVPCVKSTVFEPQES